MKVKGKGSVMLSYIPLIFIITAAVAVWLLVFMHQIFGGLPQAAAVTGAVVGCGVGGVITGGAVWAACIAGGLGGSAAGFASFGGLSLIFGANAVDIQIDSVADIQETGSYPEQILASNHGDASVKEGLRDYLYCRQYRGGCSIDVESINDTVERVVGARSYRFAAMSPGGDTAFEVSSGSFSEGPTRYRLPVALPGGETAAVHLSVAGPKGGVMWE